MSGLQGKDILVVDDADDIRMLARKILENIGADVTEASDVATGLELAKKKQPHLILLDLQFIGGPSGFEFLKARQSEVLIRNIPTIVFSSLNDKLSVSEAITLGATDYLIKPFQANHLIQKVRKNLMVTSFQKVLFDENTEPAFEIIVPAELTELTEYGFKIESVAKLEGDQLVNVKSDLLQKFNVQDAKIKSSSRPAKYVRPGRYLNQVVFSGIGEDFVKRVRKAMGE